VEAFRIWIALSWLAVTVHGDATTPILLKTYGSNLSADQHALIRGMLNDEALSCAEIAVARP
jgi:hypothetical protein